MTLPAGATVYNKRPLPTQVDALPAFLGRELNVVDRAIKSTALVPARRVTANVTLTDEDRVVVADGTAGPFTITLPAARPFTGRQFTFKKADSANTVTVDAPDLLDGLTSYAMTTQYEAFTIQSDGTTWWVLNAL